MTWRLAESLVQLRGEIETAHPGTTFWTIGDASHVVSDHRPNAQGVVCAADVLADGGLNLHKFADHLRAHPTPALKYVIYDRRIATRGNDFHWQPYYGTNPHAHHVHVSVGRGPDGRSTGPYDDESPWGLLEDIMPTPDQIARAVWSTDGVVTNASSGSEWTAGTMLENIEADGDATNAHLRDVIVMLTASKKRDEALMAAVVGGDDARRIIERIDQLAAVLGSPERLAERIAARLDHDLDVAAVAQALREVFGELGSAEGGGDTEVKP